MSLVVKPYLQPNETHALTKDEVMDFCGKAFGMCYLEDDIETIMLESPEESAKRSRGCIKSQHHSGFDHAKHTFTMTGISKMLAMILNNQGKYATSEKSGRYTVLDIDDPEENRLRTKWQEIFFGILFEKYHDDFYKFYEKPKLTPEQIEAKVKLALVKKAQENSRLVTTVFTKTKMVYSIDTRQLSYLKYEMEHFIATEPDTPFYARIKAEMKEFLEATEPYGLLERGLSPETKGLTLPFFHPVREEEFGLNYSVNSAMSIATFAQNQRHRTVRCTVEMPEEGKEEYFVPEFIKDDLALVEEWIADLKSKTMEGDYPQALIIYVNERGRYEDFIMKAYERMCGAAQYEVMKVTVGQYEKYMANVTSVEAKEALEKLSPCVRCMFGFKCTAPCPFGPKNALTREF